ncbi:P-loop containing nucleoside triphosphate hydrolase protein [Obelidium mucronatum]|nr:P-loop containing nucleoside triphosphate hydrolase protein [Obelidium mucronatum]
MMQQTTQHNIVVLGDIGVGKTALVSQYCFDTFPEGHEGRMEPYRKKVLVDGQECILEILDVPGQDAFRGIRDQWFNFGDAFIFVYSITSRKSFDYIKECHKEVIAMENSRNQSCPIVIVGNKTDLAEEERQVSTMEGMDLANLLKCEFLETCVKTRYNVENAFHTVVRMLRKQQSIQSNKHACDIM